MPNFDTSYILSQFQENQPLDVLKFKSIDDSILACMIHEAMQNNVFFIESASYLQPLVLRIMSISDLNTRFLSDGVTIGDAIFRGSRTFGIRHFGKEPINPDNSASNDRYLNQGEFGVARLLFQLNVKAVSLNSRNETDAYDKASTLYGVLHTAFLEYLSSNKKEVDEPVI